MANILKDTIYFNGKNKDKFWARLEYEVRATDNIKRTKDIRIYGYICSARNYSGSGGRCSYKINDVEVGSFTSISGGSNKLIGYLDTKVQFDEAGRGSLDWKVLVDTPWSLGDAKANGNQPLENIPVKSKVTCTDGNIGSAVSINIQSASNLFRHTLNVSFGTIYSEIVRDVVNNYGWVLPDFLYTQIPSAKSGKGTIICETYDNGVLLGTTETTFTAYAVEGNCNPQVNAVIEDINPLSLNLTGDKNKLIKGISNAHIKINANARKSARLTNTGAICGDGKSGNGNDIILNAVENEWFNVYATDSRGYTKNEYYQKTIVNYIPLTCNINIYRPQPTTGEVKLDINGNYFNGSFGAVSNALEIKYRHKANDGSSGYNLLNEALITKYGDTYWESDRTKGIKLNKGKYTISSNYVLSAIRIMNQANSSQIASKENIKEYSFDINSPTTIYATFFDNNPIPNDIKLQINEGDLKPYQPYGGFSEYIIISPTISGNNYSYSASLGTGFDYQKSYDFEIVATDKIKSLTIPYHVAEGVPMLGLFKYHLEAFGTNIFENIGGKILLNQETKENYSNNEQKIGLYNGEILYRKVVSSLTAPAISQTKILDKINGLKEVINITSNWTKDGFNYHQSNPAESPVLFIDNQGNVTESHKNAYFNNANIKVIIEYTKR